MKNPIEHFVTRGLILTLPVALVLQGCALHRTQPDAPPVALPSQYHTPTDIGSAAATSWISFGDPELDRLIARATSDNLDIATAKARITAARAAIGVARSQSLPQINAGGRISHEHLSDNGLMGSAPAGAFPGTYTVSDVGLDASWELDLFGAHAAERRRAQANHRETLADLDALRLSLTAEVARAFIEHVVLAEQLASVDQVVQLREQSLQLTQLRFEAGNAAAVDVARARLDLESAKTTAPTLRAELEAHRHAMGALLGTGEYVALPTTSPLLGTRFSIVNVDASLAVGLPAELLRRRPDIREAEAQFQAATAMHDIAVADQFPRISLVSGVGMESLHSGSLFDAASRYWSLGPQISLPLFDGGRRKAVTRERQAEVEAATAAYRQSVITALTDVEQALLRHRGARDAMQASVATLQQAGEVLTQETARYRGGESALIDLLDVQRQFERELQNSLDAKQQALLSFVTLRKVLGGEFESAPVASP